jgi:hypothetical protein
VTTPTVDVEAIRWFRFRRHQLDGDAAARGKGGDVALLDYGVQDTGPDGAAWALAIRGVDVSPASLSKAATARHATFLGRR